MFEGNPTEIEGFEIPYDGPMFLTVLAIHVLAGLTCVVSGIFAMLSRKQRGTHSRAGKVYYWGLWVVFLTATLIATARWPEDHHLFFLGLVSFAAAFLGRRALRKRWGKWTLYHI